MNVDLTTADVAVPDGEPRIRDLKLGFALGMQNPHAVRRIVARNLAEIESHGRISATVAEPSVKGGRPGSEYWLNEPQALLVCMFSRAPRAAEVRRAVIAVFMAFRRGEIQSVPEQAPALDPLDPLERRLARLERLIGHHPATETPAFARVVAHVLPSAIGSSIKRYPAFWGDMEVREFLTNQHRQCTIFSALRQIQDRFGASRTPSKSAIARFWVALDRLRGTDAGNVKNRRVA